MNRLFLGYLTLDAVREWTTSALSRSSSDSSSKPNAKRDRSPQPESPQRKVDGQGRAEAYRKKGYSVVPKSKEFRDFIQNDEALSVIDGARRNQ